MNMMQRFKKLQPKEQFLTLIVSYFALNVIFGFLFLLKKKNYLPSLDVNYNGTEVSVITYLLHVINLLLALSILIRLYKGYGLKGKSIAGLILLMIGEFSFVANAVIIFCESSSPAFSLLLSFVMAAFFVIKAVGIIMFISGSPVDARLKTFVKWTPFIPLIVSVIITVLTTSDSEMFSFFVRDVIYWFVNLLIFHGVYRLARRAASR